MKKILFASIIILICNTKINAQASKDLAIATTVTVQKSPARITINWTALANASDIRIYRRIKGATTFSFITSLATSATQYIDNSVTVGVEYEYFIHKIPTSGNPESVAYISSGIEVAEVDYRGVLILVIDSTFKTSLASEITQLKEDLTGDGWQVKSFYAKRTESISLIKSKIINLYLTDSLNTKAVYILGHVPVPYSGDYNPDAHPDHKGAWPADNYYGDRHNQWWTDTWVNNTAASGTRNDNIPGDGKFDNDDVPGPNFKIEMQVGRVDLYNMPAFPKTETQLLSQYITKSHNYKHKVFNAQRRMLIQDGFGYMGGEAFAASGWRNGYSMVGGANVTTGNFFTTLGTSDYLLSYLNGGGSYSSCGSSVTADFDTTAVKTVFTMLFGSYFGDWDSQNNFLRAPLASAGWSLTSVWSGRPYFIMHHMGMGENIGYTTRLTQNNFSEYKTNTLFGTATNYLALMGDPSLRLHTVAPAQNLVATPILANTQISLTWTASAETVLGYHVYRKNPSTNIYTRINSSMVTGTSFTDTSPYSGTNYYMVRAVKLETGSGTYFNLSQGIFANAFSYVGIEPVVINPYEVKLFPNPAQNNVTMQFNNISNESTVNIIIYDLVGKALVESRNINVTNGINHLNFDINHLPAGIYNCSFETGNNHKHSERLIIVR